MASQDGMTYRSVSAVMAGNPTSPGPRILSAYSVCEDDGTLIGYAVQHDTAPEFRWQAYDEHRRPIEGQAGRTRADVGQCLRWRSMEGEH